MKTLSLRLAQQLAMPKGTAGRLIGRAMDIANRRPMREALRLLEPADGDRILDAGCGTGAATQAMLERASCEVVGVDVSQTMIKTARRRLGGRAQFFEADIGALPFANATFDAALALNVLYFDDPGGTMLRSLHRVLKPGGRLVVYVTDAESMRDWAFTRHGTHRLYCREMLRDALIRAGFASADIEVQDMRVAGSVMGLLARATRSSGRNS